MDAEVQTEIEVVVPREPAREFESPYRVGPFGLELRGAMSLEEQRRRGDRRADAAESPSQVAPQVEHAEMQTRRRLDEYPLWRGRGGWRGCAHELTGWGGRGARCT